MNIKSQSPTIRSYGTPSIFSGTNLWTVVDISENPEVHDYHWFFNGKDSGVSANNGDFKPNYSASLFTGRGSFQKNLDLLNARINTIHKELSYWDLYRITQTVSTAESFPSVISGLAVGNSAVINCNTFTYNNTTYHRGDVIVKISDLNEVKVDAINTGVFVPTKFEQVDGGYSLHYTYTESVDPDTTTIVDGLNIATTGNAIYGQSYIFESIGSEHFYIERFGGTEGTLIKPVVKSFILNDDNQYEEIVLDNDSLAITCDATQWAIELLEKPLSYNIYVQVK